MTVSETPTPYRIMYRRARIGHCRALILLLAILAGCTGVEEGDTGTPPPLVEAVQARSGALPLEEQLHGVVRAEDQVSIRSEISAPVAEVRVKNGEAVARGQVLVRLQDGELQEALRRAEADVRFAEASAAEADARQGELEARVRRTRVLAAESLISDMDLESQEAQLAAARASVAAALARIDQARASAEQSRSALAKTLVRSPVEGWVGERNAEVGMLADPGTVLFAVGNLDRLIVEVPLTEPMLRYLREGQRARILPRGAGQTPVEARLSRISPFLDEESFTTVGEIDVESAEGRLRPGMFVLVRVFYGESEQATLIPVSALWEDPGSGERGVFVVEQTDGLDLPAEGLAEASDNPRAVAFRRLEIVGEGRGTAGVAGIAALDWVVVTGQHLLGRAMQDGQSADIGEVEARIRPITWERIQELQGMQREDLLEGFLDKQQRLARVLGAEIPESEAVVERVLRESQLETAASSTAPAGGS